MTGPAAAPTRLALALAAAALLVVAFVPAFGSTGGAATPSRPSAAFSAATWLAAQSADGIYSNGGIPDWGLTADAALAFAAGGNGTTAGATTVGQLRTHATEYIAPGGGTDRSAAGLTKLLVVAAVQGDDVTSFGGWNLRTELAALVVAAPAPDAGRFRSIGASDTSNGFTQALGVIGMARTGGAPAPAVSYLLQQQCPDGGFRLFFTGGPTCTANTQSDPDTTGLVIQALTALGPNAPTVPLADAVAWLVAHQAADGSFKGTGPTATPNANSTAVAAQGLRVAGRTQEADAAAAWLIGLQLGCDAGIAADFGAVAYSTPVRATTVAGGAVLNMYRDQYRRATAQAILGLTGGSLATMTAAAPSPGAVAIDCSAGSTTTTTLPGATTTTTLPGWTSTSTTTSTTVPGATTTSTTTSTTAPGATTTIDPTATTTSTTAATRVLSTTATRSTSSNSSASQSASSSGSGLAATGSGPSRAVGIALLVLSAGLGLTALRQRAR